MLKAQLEVENVALREKIAQLETVGPEGHVQALKAQLEVWQKRVHELEGIMGKFSLLAFVERCKLLGLKDEQAIDIGVRAGWLREAARILSDEPEVELTAQMEEPGEEDG